MNTKSKTVAVCAVLTALTAVMGAIPFVFLIPLLFACVTQNVKISAFMGLVFGVISFVYSLMGGSVVAAAFVQAPWIAIVPRIAVGFIAHGVFVLCKKLIREKGKVSRVLPYSVSAAVGSLSNTVLVVALLMIFMRDTALGDITVYLYLPTMLINGAIEFAVCTALVPTLALSVGKALGKRGLVYTSPKKAEENKVSENADSAVVGNADNTCGESSGK